MEYAMQNATSHTIVFVVGVIIGLFCKVKMDNVEAYDKGYDHGYDHGFSDASMAVEFLSKRMEGK